ncbi:Gfo/Idh/MocA family protein [Ruegeria profundi]|uniref:Gfo/Idh/MocA family protein n=1 Tax=Ruegeria profundi TaxID=1685378 RepID=UPI001CD5E597|nr:Gfo/Idh/MocA family oxidoreductase [Ruegeria profundi]MCA0928244.1 Gfo/Idh/MocA family oxidoreductase [Ruegeria profundi]
MDRVRWGIIGCGDLTEVKSGPGFQKASNTTLTVVMRRNRDLAADYANRHGVPEWTDDAEKLAFSPNVDAIYIATPPDTHLALTELAAKAGKPILVEKPLANRLADAERMGEYCAERGVRLFCAFYRRALPRFLKIKDLLDTGAIGQPNSFKIMHAKAPPSEEEAGWRHAPGAGDGGIFMDMGSHAIDLTQFLLGHFTECRGTSKNISGQFDVPDEVTASFQTETGVTGTGEWVYHKHAHADRIHIEGEAGSLAFSVFDSEPVLLTSADGTRRIEADLPPHVHQPMIQAVTNAIATGASSSNDFSESIRTSRCLDTILCGYR